MVTAGQFESVLDYANFLIDTIGGRDDSSNVGGPCAELARWYRALGLFQLLIQANTDALFHCLISSGLTWKYYLERSAREGFVSSPARKASYVAPFADAVAASQLGLARQLGRLAPPEWREEFEYGEDFEYARFLYRLVDGAGDAELGAILEAFEAHLEGGQDPRLAVCHALRGSDGQAFDAALLDWIEARQAKLAETGDSGEWDFEANRDVCVEGLALVRLAEERGLPTRAEYPHCPGIARIRDYAPFVPDSFPNLPLTDD